LLNDVKVIFAPEATVFATMPHDARNAESQRARWEGGRFGVIRQYARALLVQALKKRSVVVLDGLIDLLTPALVNLMIGNLMMLVLSLSLWQLGSGSIVMTAIWAGVFAAGIGHVVLGAMAAGQREDMMRLFRHVPRYVFWKLGVYARMVTSAGTDEWVRTARESVRGNRKGGRS